MKNCYLYFFLIFFLFLFPAFSEGRWKATFSPSQSTFIADDWCPGEGCMFGYWKARKITSLYKAPRGTKIIGEIKEGEWVKGMTGIVYTKPTKVQVTETVSFPLYFASVVTGQSEPASAKLSPGDAAYILTASGEGFCLAWSLGKFIFVPTKYDEKTGTFLEWGKIVGENNLEKDEWWAKIKLPNGRTGWVKEPDFDGIDSLSGWNEKPVVPF